MTKFCPSCGEKLVDNARFCKNCGASLSGDGVAPKRPEMPEVEKSYTVFIVIGYILSVLFSLIGFILGIYLITRKDSKSANRHGVYIIIICVVIWAFTFLRFLF